MVRDRVVLHGVAASVTALILAPLARPGYVLSYDMNFVPRQPLRLDLLAPVDTPPRAVPLDAAVGLANTIVPGWLLQRLVLAAIIWVAVVGAARLVPADSLGARLVAGVCYGWSPYLAERLFIGHWGLLCAYAMMPWLVSAARKVRAGIEGGWPRLVLAAGLCALTPTGGVIATVVCLALLPWRRWAGTLAILLVANGPWLVAWALTRAGGSADPAGVTAFAARSENWAGALVALLGTGGIWNRETTPTSRAWLFVPLVTLALLVVAAFGFRVLMRHELRRLGIAALVGLVLAAVTTTRPGIAVVTWLVREVPGTGLLRDAQKFVLPYALLLAVCVGLGARHLADRLPVESGRVLLAGFVLLLVGGMPDLAYGGAGALTPVRYPADWAVVARHVGTLPEPVLSLPLAEYRRYAWNRDRPVLDPAPRYLPAPVVTDDVLIVGGEPIEGEDRRLLVVRASLASGRPIEGFRWVLVQDGSTSELPGYRLVYSGPSLSLYRSDASVVSARPRRQWVVVGAEIAALLALITAAATMAVRTRR